MWNHREYIEELTKCIYVRTDLYTLLKLHRRKKYELLKTGLNNVVLTTLFNVVNNIIQRCYT